MTNKCKGCKQDLPPTVVQQGGFHVACAEEMIPVWKVWPKDHGAPCIYPENEQATMLDLIADCGDEEEWIIVRSKMSRIQLDNLKEHTGW